MWLARLLLALPLLAAAQPSLGAGAATDANDARAKRLAGSLAVPALRRAQVAALVVRLSDGETVFARNAAAALVPASNLKLLTALAALSHFGPAYRFTTRVYSDAAPDAAGSVGILYVRGGGDPALTSEDWWRLAADLRRGGLRRVRDAVVLDDGAFDGERWLASWGQVSARAYHAPVGALNANYGAFLLEVTPGARPGDPVRVVLDPPVPYLSLSVLAQTAARNEPDTLDVGRVAGVDAETVSITGALPAGAPAREVPRSVADPTRYAGAVLRMQLEANGIALPAQTRVGAVPAGAHELLAFSGRPLAEVVRLLSKFSNNEVAEGLVKALAVDVHGEPGSWANGLAAMRRELEAQGLDGSSLVLADGSGLSISNRVSPTLLVAALRLARGSFRYGPELISSLPIAGADGTLRKRAPGAAGAVRAKTGLLDGVVALSGYASAAEGELAFSLLINGYRSSDEAAMAAVDDFAAALVSPLAAPATTRRTAPSAPAS